MSEKKNGLKDCGCLWKRRDKNGQPYFSGIINLGALGTVSVAIFSTNSDGDDKLPDYRITTFED